MAKTLVEKIAVMQAALDGKQIQFHGTPVTPDTRWCNVLNNLLLNWDWVACDYRVRPHEPRVVYVNEYKDGLGSFSYTRFSAAECAGVQRRDNNFVATRKFVEVIEDGAS